MEPFVRTLEEKDYERYLELWEMCFGDKRGTVEEFLKVFYDDIKIYVLTDNSDIYAELTQFYMGDLILSEDISSRALVSYAICTDDRFRDRGYGSLITSHVKDLTCNDGSISVLSPADKTLIKFYENLGYIGFFLKEVREVYASYLDDIKISGKYTDIFKSINKLRSYEYNEKREAILKDRIHIKLSDHTVEYVEKCSGRFGLFEFCGGNIICACEDREEKDVLYVTELLKYEYDSPDSEELKILMAYLALDSGCEKCIYHMPAEKDSPTSEIQAMIAISDGDVCEDIQFGDLRKSSRSPWFGFSFS